LKNRPSSQTPSQKAQHNCGSINLHQPAGVSGSSPQEPIASSPPPSIRERGEILAQGLHGRGTT
ncbi:hypothetical protein TNIN_125011, partial [Trichonephila inaurata madagascariensis]